MEFRDIIKRIRNQLKITQEQLVREFSRSFSSIGRWGKGYIISIRLKVESFCDSYENDFIDIPVDLF